MTCVRERRLTLQYLGVDREYSLSVNVAAGEPSDDEDEDAMSE